MQVNIEKTKAYYDTLDTNALCSCVSCKLFYAKAKQAFPMLNSYLQELGVDIEKPFEAMSIDAEEKGLVNYICLQYLAFGKCKDSFEHRLGDYLIKKAFFYPSTGIQEEHFVLEVLPVDSMQLFME